jgi:hypothetical protein
LGKIFEDLISGMMNRKKAFDKIEANPEGY